MRAGHDFVDRDADATDPPGPHRTAVAGVAAGRANNGFGGVGTCFSCDLMPLRVLGLDGIAFNTNTAAAIDHAVDHGVAVVNVSLYGPHSPPRLRDAVARARAAGVLVVAAAGNEGTDAAQYPAAFPEAVSVGAAAPSGTLATYSGHGAWVEFAAPECAPVTAIGGETLIGCATSVASPLVAGIVALLRTHAPYASADEIESALARTARPVAGTRHGLVDAAAAIAALGEPSPTLRPVVLGTPAVGATLEALSGVWSGAGLLIAYQWERCRESCSAIPGATAPRYAPVPADLGHGLRVTVSSPNVASATSATTSPVAALPASLTRPSIAGRARVGSVLTARLETWSGTDVKLTPTWLRCRSGSCSAMKIGHRHRLRAADRGSRIKLSVVGSNALGSSTVVSRPTAVVR